MPLGAFCDHTSKHFQRASRSSFSTSVYEQFGPEPGSWWIQHRGALRWAIQHDELAPPPPTELSFTCNEVHSKFQIAADVHRWAVPCAAAGRQRWRPHLSPIADPRCSDADPVCTSTGLAAWRVRSSRGRMMRVPGRAGVI